MKSDDEKKPSSMVRPHGPWCKPTLSVGHIDVVVDMNDYQTFDVTFVFE